MYVKKGQEHRFTKPLKFVSDTQHPRKLMLTGVVMRPVGVNGSVFDGKIGLWRTGHYEIAQKKSKNRDAGTEYFVDDTIDQHAYFRTMENTVFPELRAAAEILKINKIWLQDDNASPHKAARKRLNELGSGYNRGAKIEMKNQSARSPDFNALDAYVWRVLQKAVDKKMPRDDKELVDAIDWAWKERLTAWHLEMAFRVIGTACRQTIECGGGNNYRLAHDGHRKAMIAEGWVQPEWCK